MQRRTIKDMNKLKTIVLLTTLMILLGCGGPQRERKMKMAKFKSEQSKIKPISVTKDVVKNEDTVSIVTTTMYTNKDFDKLKEIREKRSVKRKQK